MEYIFQFQILSNGYILIRKIPNGYIFQNLQIQKNAKKEEKKHTTRRHTRGHTHTHARGEESKWKK